MILQEIFHFRPSDFDNNGFHKKTMQLFSEFIKECEEKFYKKHQPFFANIFSANSSTMLLLKNCMNDSSDQIYGMESTDGDVNLEMNFEIENHSITQTIYAIECYKDKNKQ